MSYVFQIDKNYMLHEGGTKFYQVLRVIAKPKDGWLSSVGAKPVGARVTVTHWGKQVGEPGPLRVQDHGNTKVEKGDSYGTAIAGKRKRGYADEIRWGQTEKFDSTEAFEVALTAEFGARVGDEIRIALGLQIAGHKAESEPITGPHSSTTVPESRPDLESDPGWGAW